MRLKRGEFTELFFKAIDPLRVTGRLGAVLFQLPPNLKVDVELLKGFLQVIQSGKSQYVAIQPLCAPDLPQLAPSRAPPAPML